MSSLPSNRAPLHLTTSPSLRDRLLSAELTPTAEEPEKENLEGGVGVDVSFKSRGFFHHDSNNDQDNRAVSASWWDENPNRDQLVQRRRSLKHRILPPEQEIAYQRTKLAVLKALGKSVDVALDVTREVLEVGVNALEFAPVPGLAACADILSNIWNNVQDVETNRLSCLSLTERCANILFSIKAEIEIVGEGDGGLADSLREPVEKLTESFRRIEEFISKHVSRPFLKRYLKRDEDARRITFLEAGLTDTVSLFNVAIQLRMLKGIHDLGYHSSSPVSKLPPSVGEGGTLSPVIETPSPPTPSKPGIPSPVSGGGEVLTPTNKTQASGVPMTSREIVAAIAAIRSSETVQNSILDAADLYAAMRVALRSADDAKILELLEIDKSEIQEAIKTIQRALEDPKLAPKSARTAIESVTSTAPTTSSVAGPNTSTSIVVTPPQFQPLTATTSDTIDTATRSTKAKFVWPPPEDISSGSVAIAADQDQEQDVTFHREFLESGLEALRRLSAVPSRAGAGARGAEGVPVGRGDRSGAGAGVGGVTRGSVGDVASGAGIGESLPPWTITKWEVDRENKIGWGVFSDVYKGTWRGQTVAIKVLAKTTSRSLFKNEISIWASLNHPNVLKLLGASSATSDPPWFFVSPYMKNGTVELFLRTRGASINASVGAGAAGGGSGSVDQVQAGPGMMSMPTPLQMMMEIAVGMAYLHRKGVLHGDLKANNILIDDHFHCVISDFGQSKLRSEVYRLSQSNEERGNLRWQAPEIMSGHSNLTPQADVYSFGIVCYEILSGGQVPWAMLDDQTVQRLVLMHDKRPAIPFTPETPLALVTLIDECWHKDAFVRPLFVEIAKRIGVLLNGGVNKRISRVNSPSPHRRIQALVQDETGQPLESHVSPDMAPVDLPGDDRWTAYDFGAPLSLTTSRNSVLSEPAPPFDDNASGRSTFGAPLTKTMSAIIGAQPPSYDASQSRGRAVDRFGDSHDKGKGKEDKTSERTTTTRKTTTLTTLTRSSSVHSWLNSSSSESDGDLIWGKGTITSPLGPPDPEVMERWDERRYRLLLQHDFHPTLILPLWTPSPVMLGDVGYLSKPSGKFVSFFNCRHPFEAADKRVHGMASIHGHGNYREASHTRSPHKRNFAQIGRDIVKGILSTKGSTSVKRTVSYRLRAGHRHAYLVTEYTTYRYMVDIDIAKAWFKANIKTIWKAFGRELGLHREDIVLVIGLLEARDYALFVSHENPDGQVHFDVFGERKEGSEWGAFRTDEGVPEEVGELEEPILGYKAETAKGGAYGKDTGLSFVHSAKVSRVPSSGSGADSVLLARLRFKPDEDEPTRL